MGFYTPSQLVQDAKRHGITVSSVCINASSYEHTLELVSGSKAIRLGFCLVKGLSEEGAKTIISHRPGSGYTSINEVRKCYSHEADLSALASANAFSTISGNRYQARWAMMDKHLSLPLFNQQPEQISLAFEPDETASLIEDIASMSLSVESHPISLLLKHKHVANLTLAKDLAHKPHGSVVHVFGCVTCRQAPGTASGATFFTLEDHTGNMNIVVWQATARHQQQAYLKAQILTIDGILERSPEGVMHIIAGKLTDCSDWLSEVTISSRNFH